MTRDLNLSRTDVQYDLHMATLFTVSGKNAVLSDKLSSIHPLLDLNLVRGDWIGHLLLEQFMFYYCYLDRLVVHCRLRILHFTIYDKMKCLKINQQQR